MRYWKRQPRGRPIVATAAGGTGEIVIDGETGLLVPTNDRAALASAMSRAVQDPELRSRLGLPRASMLQRRSGWIASWPNSRPCTRS